MAAALFEGVIRDMIAMQGDDHGNTSRVSEATAWPSRIFLARRCPFKCLQK